MVYSLLRRFPFIYICISLSLHLYLGNPLHISPYLIKADLTDTSIAEKFTYLLIGPFLHVRTSILHAEQNIYQCNWNCSKRQIPVHLDCHLSLSLCADFASLLHFLSYTTLPKPSEQHPEPLISLQTRRKERIVYCV